MKILLTSLPRSGSTWVLSCLSQAKGVVPVFEPDYLGDHGLGANGMHPYIPVDKEDQAYEKIYADAFAGRKKIPVSLSRVYVERTAKNLKTRFVAPKHVVVKTVYSLANTEWIYRRFRPKVVLLLRNPYSISHSIHRKWPEAELQDLLGQGQLMEDYLNPYRSIIASAAGPYQVLASRI